DRLRARHARRVRRGRRALAEHGARRGRRKARVVRGVGRLAGALPDGCGLAQSPPLRPGPAPTAGASGRTVTAPRRTGRIRVLHIARNFPNAALPRLGLLTERLVRSTLGACEPTVIAPVPYWPPI